MMKNNGSLDTVSNDFPQKVVDMGLYLLEHREWITKQIRLHNEFGEFKYSIMYMDHAGRFFIAPDWPNIDMCRDFEATVDGENEQQLRGIQYYFNKDADRTRSFFYHCVVNIADLMIYWSKYED